MEWAIAKAKAKFSAVIGQATREGAQTITRFGEPAAVVLSYADYQRLLKAPPFKEFLRSGNIPEVGVPGRPDVKARDIQW